MSDPRRWYGAHPLHLLIVLAGFALAGYVVSLTVGHYPDVPWMLLWFAGALVAHDLVLFPIYALLDRFGARLSRPRHAVNHVRIPTLASGLLLLLFLPGIIEQGRQTYLDATGQTQAPYLGRWLLITAVLYGASAIIFTIRHMTRRTARAHHRDP